MPTSFTPKERWQRLENLFNEAVDLPEEQRSDFLDRECGGDSQLRSELETLLNNSETSCEGLDRVVQNAAQDFLQRGPKRPQAGTRLEQYEITGRLGAGGMGEVFLARDVRLKRKVALKILAPHLTRSQNALRRFEQEAQAVSALNHPNILVIYECGEADGLLFIAAEFIEGDTLRTLFRQSRLELKATVDVGVQIAAALTAAHASGIIHRDIKPENVMLRNDNIVKVLDFGIAKLTEPSSDGLSTSGEPLAQTQTGVVLGTARYMSPEQARGIQVDHRTDIFSLGALLYEALAGRPAFQGDTRSDIIAEILKTEPPRLSALVPDAPRELIRIIDKCLRKDRELRYQTTKDLLIDLQELKRELDSGASIPRAAEISTGSFTPHGKAAQVAAAPERQSSTKTAKRRLAPAWIIAAMLAIAALAIVFGVLTRSPGGAGSHSPRSLAVLPFQNLKKDPQIDYLGFSLADAIITKLGYVASLTVRPSSSISAYRNTTDDSRKIAHDLKVQMLLTGNFVRDGDQLRISTQLIDVKLDSILWQDTIDLQFDRLLRVQDDVSQAVIKGLELKLSPVEAQHLRPEPAVNTQAYEYYLRGVDLYSVGDYPLAIEMLEKSAAIDPSYALTWAHLGRAYTTNASLQFGGRVEYRKAQQDYEKAISLNPALPEPRIYMANLFTDTGRVEESVPLLRVALESSPNNAEAHWELGYAYRFGGMLTDSVRECELARQLDPEVKIHSSALNAYLYLGEYDKFLRSLPPNDSTFILFYRGFAKYYKHDLQGAAKDFDRAYELSPDLLPAEIGRALSDKISNRNAAGLKMLRDTEARIEASGVSDPEALYKVAQAYAVLGSKADALRILQRSVDGGFFCAGYIGVDPLLENLHGNATFQALLSQAKLRQDQFRRRFSSAHTTAASKAN